MGLCLIHFPIRPYNLINTAGLIPLRQFTVFVPARSGSRRELACRDAAGRPLAAGLHPGQGLGAVEKREDLSGAHAGGLARDGFLPSARRKHGIKLFLRGRHKSIPSVSRYAQDDNLARGSRH